MPTSYFVRFLTEAVPGRKDDAEDVRTTTPLPGGCCGRGQRQPCVPEGGSAGSQRSRAAPGAPRTAPGVAQTADDPAAASSPDATDRYCGRDRARRGSGTGSAPSFVRATLRRGPNKRVTQVPALTLVESPDGLAVPQRSLRHRWRPVCVTQGPCRLRPDLANGTAWLRPLRLPRPLYFGIC